MKMEKINFEQFEKIIDSTGIKNELNVEYLFDVYNLSIEAIEELFNSGIIPKYQNVNVTELTYYILGEYLYTVIGRKKEELKEFFDNDEIKASMASVSSDKYVSLSAFNYKEDIIANKFTPPMSSLNLYSNFMLKILEGYQKKSPETTLIVDLLNKSLSIVRCILQLLMNGNETEALASWRTLHECECTLILLDRYQDKLIKEYLKHMEYGIAYRDGIEDKTKQDAIFEKMKEEMKALDLKSKDMKKYIEYGWLSSLDEVKNDETFKFNFRDGLEKVSGLSKYSDSYQLSSEILHCTPLLIYSNKKYFYFLTLIRTYESFFRLEKVFVNLFAPRVGKEGMTRYQGMRNIYYSQLANIYSRESTTFQHLFGNKKIEK